MTRIPEIFKCYTGIVPYSCPELTKNIKLEVINTHNSNTGIFDTEFQGYPFPDRSNTDCFYYSDKPGSKENGAYPKYSTKYFCDVLKT